MGVMIFLIFILNPGFIASTNGRNIFLIMMYLLIPGILETLTSFPNSIEPLLLHVGLRLLLGISDIRLILRQGLLLAHDLSI